MGLDVDGRHWEYGCQVMVGCGHRRESSHTGEWTEDRVGDCGVDREVGRRDCLVKDGFACVRYISPLYISSTIVPLFRIPFMHIHIRH